jgi:hypothetical protein
MLGIIAATLLIGVVAAVRARWVDGDLAVEVESDED